MSPEAQRIAIHKARGKSTTAYRFLYKSKTGGRKQESPHYETSNAAEYACERESSWSAVEAVESIESYHNTPRYTEDLNAMHGAEKVLMEPHNCGPWFKFIEHLDEIVSPKYGAETMVHATAAQRAEAFLKCLGLYVEETKS